MAKRVELAPESTMNESYSGSKSQVIFAFLQFRKIEVFLHS